MSASIIFALVLTSVSASGSPNAPLGADRLPKQDSAEFARAAERALLEPTYRKRPLGLDYNGNAEHIHFYSWTVVPTWGQGFAYFYVDRRTGTVWGSYGVCQPIHSPELTVLQPRFRRRFHISASTVRQIDQEGSPQLECHP